MGLEDQTSALRVLMVATIIARTGSRHHPTSRVRIKSRGAMADYAARQQAGSRTKGVTYDVDDSSAVCGRGITCTETSLIRVMYFTLPTHITVLGFNRLWTVECNNTRWLDN